MTAKRASFYSGISALIVLLSTPVLALEPVGGRTIAGGAAEAAQPTGTFPGVVPLLMSNQAVKAACLTAELISGSSPATFYFAKGGQLTTNSVGESLTLQGGHSGATCAKDFDYAMYFCQGVACQFRWRIDAVK